MIITYNDFSESIKLTKDYKLKVWNDEYDFELSIL